MTWRQFWCSHKDTYRVRTPNGLLATQCWACGHQQPFGLQERAYGPAEPSKAIPKAKRAPRVQRPAVVRFPKVVNK